MNSVYGGRYQHMQDFEDAGTGTQDLQWQHLTGGVAAQPVQGRIHSFRNMSECVKSAALDNRLHYPVQLMSAALQNSQLYLGFLTDTLPRR